MRELEVAQQAEGLKTKLEHAINQLKQAQQSFESLTHSKDEAAGSLKNSGFVRGIKLARELKSIENELKSAENLLMEATQQKEEVERNHKEASLAKSRQTGYKDSSAIKGQISDLEKTNYLVPR